MADAIVVENYTTVIEIEDSTPDPNTVENVVGTATVVETEAATSIEVTSTTGLVTSVDVPAAATYTVEVEEIIYEIETAIGPTGYTPQLYSGTAPPSEATGTVGDLYLVNSGPTIGDLYQKDKAGWGTSKGNLRGGIASVNGISGTNITIAANNITTGVLPIAQVPTGTTGTTVALGNHLHTGVYEPVIATGLTTQFWRGDKSWIVIDKASLGLGNVTNFDTTNADNITSGTLAFARHPTGTTGTTLAIGNHNHDAVYVALAGTQTVGGAKTFSNVLEASAGAAAFKVTPGAADHTYIAWHARTASPGTRSAYMGYGSAASNALNIVNEITAGNIAIQVTGAGQIQLTAPTVAVSSALTTATLKVGSSTTAGYVLTADASGNATWQQTANIITPGTTAQYYRGDLTWQTLNAATVGLGNVVNSVAVDLTTNQTIAGTKTFTSEIVGPTTGNVLKVGDDARIVDVNLANAIAIVGIQNSALGGIVFGTNPTNWRIELTSAQAANITGNTQMIGSLTVTNGVTVSAGSISGNGSGLTNLPATSLTGTIDIARVPTGTSSSTVAFGNHLHAGVYEPVLATGTTAQYYRGDKSWQALTPAAVGLGNVANVVQVDLTSGQTITGAKTFTNGSNVFSGDGGGLTNLTATQLTAGIVSQARLVHNLQRFPFTTGSEARPTGATYVEWIGPVQPANASTNDTWTDTSLQVIEDPIIGMPIGMVQMFVSTTAPTNWMSCNGTAISRTTYSALYAIIGTTYGTGDGATTFNLPDFRGRVGIGNSGTYAMGAVGGAATHTLTTAEMPSHTHTQNPHNHATSLDAGTNGYSGGIAGGVFFCNTPPTHPGYFYMVTSDTTATNQNTGGGGAHNNMQPYIAINYIIKVL